MNKYIIPFLALTVFLSFASALYVGETYEKQLESDIVNCSVTSGLNVTWEGSKVFVYVEPDYNLEDFNISCWISKYTSSGGGGGGSHRHKPIINITNLTNTTNITNNTIVIPVNQTVPVENNQTIPEEVEEEIVTNKRSFFSKILDWIKLNWKKIRWAIIILFLFLILFFLIKGIRRIRQSHLNNLKW